MENTSAGFYIISFSDIPPNLNLSISFSGFYVYPMDIKSGCDTIYRNQTWNLFQKIKISFTNLCTVKTMMLENQNRCHEETGPVNCVTLIVLLSKSINEFVGHAWKMLFNFILSVCRIVNREICELRIIICHHRPKTCFHLHLD